jgi:hypothetical protein
MSPKVIESIRKIEFSHLFHPIFKRIPGPERPIPPRCGPETPLRGQFDHELRQIASLAPIEAPRSALQTCISVQMDRE